MPDLSRKGVCRTMSSYALRYIERRTLGLAIDAVLDIDLRRRDEDPPLLLSSSIPLLDLDKRASSVFA